MSISLQDVLVVGGGPAGLSAALLLGRCLRKVVVCDAGRPRNERSLAMHGYLGLDGVPPREFLERSRMQLSRYETVTQTSATIVEVRRWDTRFLIRAEDGREWQSKAVLLATGLVDRLPTVPGLERFYGVSVHSCPYCDGWENRGRLLGVIGSDANALSLALELKIWSQEVTLFTNAPAGQQTVRPSPASDIRIVEGVITELGGEGNELQSVHVGATCCRCDSLFFSPRQIQHSALAESLGCRLENNQVACRADGCTGVEGLFVAGNAATGVQMAIVAASEGLKAAASINDWLFEYENSFLA